MDNLKSIFDKQDYDLVIKLTKTSSDPDDLFYCLSAYLSLNRIDDALALIKEKHLLLEKRLPMLMKSHIELLCLKGNYEEAYQQVDYYKNLPYYSQEAEEILKDLPKMIRDYERKSYRSSINDDEIEKLLLSKSEQDVLFGLDALREKELSPYYLYINKILTSFPKQLVRSFCLLLLVNKKVDHNFKFLHIDKLIEVNPIKLNPPFDDTSFNNIKKKMQELYKDVSLSESALQILSTYLIYIYPDSINLDDKLLFEALHIISASYLNIEYHSSNEEECRSLVNDIRHANEDL